jgi:hypothetical protein
LRKGILRKKDSGRSGVSREGTYNEWGVLERKGER